MCIHANVKLLLVGEKEYFSLCPEEKLCTLESGVQELHL
jgi:hypothetical protein